LGLAATLAAGPSLAEDPWATERAARDQAIDRFIRDNNYVGHFAPTLSSRRDQ
jgi:hypothetical protein